MGSIGHTRVVAFQCPKCGHDLEQTMDRLKAGDRMQCHGCGVAINIDTNRLSNAADEIERAMDEIPAAITIRFYK
jgi:transcription elongation factor Elf1